MAPLSDTDYRGVLAGILVAGTLTVIGVSMAIGKVVPELTALMTLTGMAVAWYFSPKPAA